MNRSVDCYVTSELACSLVWIRSFPRPTFQPPQEVARYIHLVNPSACRRTFVETRILCTSNYFFGVLQLLSLPLYSHSSYLFLSRRASYLASRPLFWKYFLISGILSAFRNRVPYWTKSKSETWNQHEEGPSLCLFCTISRWALYRISFGINRSWMVSFSSSNPQPPLYKHLTYSYILT
jgi:hypothetical protein